VLRLSRESIAEQAGRLLAAYPIDDLSVEDPPIEDVIGRMYAAQHPV
jgi:ABC-2 type transport system ATP-binding protein